MSGRASDYYGPGAGIASPLGDRVLAAVVAGKRVSLFGDPDLVHSYTYLPDIGEGLAVLGTRTGVDRLGVAPAERPRAVDEPRHGRGALPARRHQSRASAACRRSRCAAVGIFNPTVRELVEMAYEFEEPFVVDSSRIAALGVRATPIPEALERTLAAYRADHA